METYLYLYAEYKDTSKKWKLHEIYEYDVNGKSIVNNGKGVIPIDASNFYQMDANVTDRKSTFFTLDKGKVIPDPNAIGGKPFGHSHYTIQQLKEEEWPKTLEEPDLHEYINGLIIQLDNLVHKYGGDENVRILYYFC